MSYNLLKPQSAIINPNTKDYDIVNGQIAQGNPITTEMFARLTTPKGSYAYNLDFGCKPINETMSTSEIQYTIANAIQPMIDNQMITLTNIDVQYNVAFRAITITINAVDTQSNTIYFNLKASNGGNLAIQT